MLDGLAWTHYWQRQSKATFLPAPCQCTHHIMSNGRQSPISSLHTNMPRVISFSTRLCLAFGISTRPEAGGRRESGLVLVNRVFNNDKGLTGFGCESCMYGRSLASSNPPDPLLVQPDLYERFSQLGKSDMSGETTSYAPNLGVMFAGFRVKESNPSRLEPSGVIVV